MTDKEKILAEIEKIKSEEYGSDHFDRYAKHALDRVLKFIDSLPEEPVSEDLEEAAEDELDNQNPNWAVDASGSDGEYTENAYNEFQMINMFKAGAKWQKNNEQEPKSYDLVKFADWQSIECRNQREKSGIKDPVMLDEIENAAYGGIMNGAKWQEEQIIKNAIDATVKVDAGGYLII